MANTSLAGSSDVASFSTSGTAVLGRHLLTAPVDQLSGSRGSLHSDPHSTASTPGVARHRLRSRTVSVFGSPALGSPTVGSPAIGKNVDLGSNDGMEHSPIIVKADKRQRKISAPSSLHPFDSPIEGRSDVTSGNNSHWRFSHSSKKIPRHSRKVY